MSDSTGHCQLYTRPIVTAEAEVCTTIDTYMYSLIPELAEDSSNIFRYGLHVCVMCEWWCMCISTSILRCVCVCVFTRVFTRVFSCTLCCTGRFNTMKHIRIFRDENGGFGFSAPFIFRSLQQLIEHYSQESLVKHNSDLPTRLAHPIGQKVLAEHGITAS
eukprot:scpid57335/ scgid24008/ 